MATTISKFVGTILVKQNEKKKTEFVKLFIENQESQIELFYGFNNINEVMLSFNSNTIYFGTVLIQFTQT